MTIGKFWLISKNYERVGVRKFLQREASAETGHTPGFVVSGDLEIEVRAIPGPQVRGTGGTLGFVVSWDLEIEVRAIPGPQVRGTGGTPDLC